MFLQIGNWGDFMACTSCDLACVGGCSDNCNVNCAGGCLNTCTTSCTNACTAACMGGCGGCANSCYGGCTSCQGCSSCSGCSACTGTCTGYCDNSCTAANSAQVIANLGSNILAKGIFIAGDFSDLKTAIRNEFSRRSKTLPTGDSYSVNPAIGVVLSKEHIQRVLDDVHTFNSSQNQSVGIGNVVKTSDSASTISYIQTLMSQNVRP